jgi:hypothetical protein
MRLSGTAATGTALGTASARSRISESTPKEHESRHNAHCRLKGLHKQGVKGIYPRAQN